MLRKQALSCIKMLEGREKGLGTRENKTEKFYTMPWFHKEQKLKPTDISVKGFTFWSPATRQRSHII